MQWRQDVVRSESDSSVRVYFYSLLYVCILSYVVVCYHILPSVVVSCYLHIVTERAVGVVAWHA